MYGNIHYVLKSVSSNISFKSLRFPFLTLLLCISLIISSSPSVFAHFKSEPYQESPSIVSATQPSVTIQPGDARYFADPPDVIAYANIYYTDSPPEFSIDMGGGSIWEYHEWIGLLDKTDWIEATTMVETTSVGAVSNSGEIITTAGHGS